jgi:hypothetical protein
MPDENPDPDGGAVAPDPLDTGTPRWVKVFGLIALIVVALFVVVLLVGGGEHGPGRHSPGGGSDTPGEHTGPPSGVTHTQP